ncbi:MCE family protein [Antrihabitans stalactiti]|uniref:MCE family protein n=1 Tax=Antrihabitans stalactiti TaxID=2584121 RepID=A0A848KHX0_9NOCA|nr:MlaD family protein [Antrihabitans stalactiti]NMN97889.1 MCE family protein [Antrihabitans stalactiti]
MKSLAAPLIKLGIFVIVTVLATGMLAFTIANSSGGGGSTFKARFTDVTSLNPGDEIRIAGVRVGSVRKISIVDQHKDGKPAEAEVEFALDDRDWLPSTTHATIKFRNLVGQRYIALSQDSGPQGFKINEGSTLGLDKTTPAVDLTLLFNGFRPLFQTLSADDVNNLSGEIIQVFQGEGGTIADLVSNASKLTNKIADKDAVIGSLIKNLTTILETVNQRDDELNDMIIKTERLVSGLAADRNTVGSSVQSLSDLTSATADLLVPTRPSLQGSIAGLSQLTGELVNRRDEVNDALTNLPLKMERLGRVGSYGSWFQFYLCGIDIVAGAGDNGAPQLNLPAGLPTINQPIYTNSATRCHNEAGR